MEKIEFKKSLSQWYAPKNTDEWELVDLPEMQFLMIDGEGDPNTAQSFADAIEALYAVSYTLKFMSKRTLGKDYGVAPLEGLWYADDMKIFEAGDKDAYRWTLMIMQPDWISEAMIADAIGQVKVKKNPIALPKLYTKRYQEGPSLQLLHVGSFDDEAPKLRVLHHTYMPAHGYDFAGHHHEIYLSDMRRVAPDKLRTILRQPVRPL
jgi:hypothetical protein